jgi:antibiotic biosynthesis monooxygenase (ABM) superfamily enzyme
MENDTDTNDTDTIVPSKKSVTVVVSRRVFPGREKDYDEWVRRLVTAATEAKGNTGATMLIPAPGKPGLHHVVLHFADQASVHEWEDSYIRQKLSYEADAFSRRSRQEATGLETWFSIPECPELETPPHWKMAIVTSIAVYLVSIIIVPLLGIFFKEVNFYLLSILTVALLVSILTWAVMPFFSRVIFRRWLYR